MVTTTRSTRSSARGQGTPVRQTLLVLGIVGAFLCGGYFLVGWVVGQASAHPVAAVALIAVAVPAAVALVRGMPRLGELRRAARAGMAEADAEAGAYHARRRWRRGVSSSGGTAESQREASAEPLARAGVFRAMDADEFEAAIAGLCERGGCREVSVVGGAGDLGADVVATAPDGRRVVIQCKRYCDSNKVGSQDVQRFGGTCYTVHGADVAAIVTTSEFTAPACDYAKSSGILCFDAARLAAWAEGTGAAPWTPA